MKTAFLILALGLSSCVSDSTNQKALVATEYSCAAAKAALDTAILFNDKLTPAMRADVTKAVAVINPVCSQEETPTLTSSARAAFDGALTTLTAAASQATK